MPRSERLEPAGVPLHIVQRGNNRAACFFSEVDRHFYLKCLAKAAARRSCAIHAYVLMSNHVHLLVTPAETGAVSRMMQDLGRQYVRVVNDANGRTGTLWEGRFKSNLVDSETYFMTCHRYIELNPVRAGIVENPAVYPWSSHRYYATGNPNSVITEHALYTRLASTPEQRRTTFLSLFDNSIEAGDLEKLRTAVNKGWALGSENFLDQMEAVVGRSVRAGPRGRPKKQIPEDDRADLQTEMLL